MDNGSGSTRLGTNSAPESTRVNSAGLTRPVYFPYGESGHHINYVPNKKFGRYDWNTLGKYTTLNVKEIVLDIT